MSSHNLLHQLEQAGVFTPISGTTTVPRIQYGAGAPTDGTSGTGAGVAHPGSLYIDTTNAKLYINTNTQASPTYTVVGAQTT